MRNKQELRSVSVFISLEKIEANLSQIGFSMTGNSITIVTDGKFWRKMLYTKGDEIISISEEIGDAYPKDPIITICASKKTISKVIDGVEKI